MIGIPVSTVPAAGPSCHRGPFGTPVTINDASSRTGRSATLLRKHVERGKLRATKDGGVLDISEDDLRAYLYVEQLGDLAIALEGKPLLEVVHEMRKSLLSLDDPPVFAG